MADFTGEELERLGRKLRETEAMLVLMESRLKNVEDHIFDPRDTGETIHDLIDGLDSRIQDLEYGSGEEPEYPDEAMDGFDQHISDDCGPFDP